MPKLTEETITELKAKRPGDQLVKLTANEIAGEVHEVVVRPPNREEWQRFRILMQNEQRRMKAPEEMLFWCLVWPSKDELEALLDKRPGLAETFSGAVAELAGAQRDVEKKAL